MSVRSSARPVTWRRNRCEAPPTSAPPADVYALGSMLFEILAGESLHPRGAAALPSTLAGIDGSPANRQPDRTIPPELDEVCVCRRSHSIRRRDRGASELANRVERYLDGDRDLERRRELSAEWLAKARAALSEDESRAVASKRCRVQVAPLALDPDSLEAAGFFARLFLEPAKQLPAELKQELARAEVGRAAPPIRESQRCRSSPSRCSC